MKAPRKVPGSPAGVLRAGILFAVLLAPLLLAAIPARGADLALNSVLYSDKAKSEVAFQATDRVPKATLKGSVQVEGSNATIQLSCAGLQPALLFGGDVSAWVVWAIGPGGNRQNLGELVVAGDGKGAAHLSSTQLDFALMVTAEPFTGVRRPSDLVAFSSQPSKSKGARNTPISSGELRAGTKRDVETLANLRYTSKAPVDLEQAGRLVDLVVRYEGEKHAPEATKEAQAALTQARDAQEGRSGKKSDVPVLARRAVVSATEAGRQIVASLEAMQAKEKEDKRQAQLEALGQQAEEAERKRAETAAFLDEVARARATLQAERDQLQKERDQLAQRLGGALGKVAQTEQTARGMVLSLSGGVLFDSGKSALKPGARISLAKLAGILLMLPDAKIEVEGHTDDVGSAKTNQKLSVDRARAVMTFLKDQGVEPERMTAEGFGSTKPVVANDTAANRAKNRRVDVVFGGGAGGAGATAPQ